STHLRLKGAVQIQVPGQGPAPRCHLARVSAPFHWFEGPAAGWHRCLPYEQTGTPETTEGRRPYGGPSNDELRESPAGRQSCPSQTAYPPLVFRNWILCRPRTSRVESAWLPPWIRYRPLPVSKKQTKLRPFAYM